jgi:hypothetical protein
MKKLFLMVFIVTNLETGVFGYDKGLFDLDYFGNLSAYFQVIEIPSNGRPGLISCEDIIQENKVIKSYFKMTLPQKGVNAAFKVIKDEGYSTEAYKVYMIVFSTYSFSKNAVVVFMKFDKDGSAWFDCYEVFM